jgi:hypothetical protein
VPPPTAQFAMRGKEKTSLCRQMATAIAIAPLLRWTVTYSIEKEPCEPSSDASQSGHR